MKGKFPTATALVTRVMEALNIDPEAEGAAPRLADQTGMDRVQIFRWLNGIHEPKRVVTDESPPTLPEGLLPRVLLLGEELLQEMRALREALEERRGVA